MRDWDSAYKRKGEIQSDVLALVEETASKLLEEGGKRVLDLGCGTGRHIIFLASEGFDVYGTDISNNALSITKKKLEERGLDAKLSKGDMSTLGFEKGFFDAVISTYVIHHAKLEVIRKVISEVARVLKAGGLFSFIVLSDEDGWFGRGKEIEPKTFVNNGDPTEGDIPHHYFSESELREELKSFEILELFHTHSYSTRRKVKLAQFEVICIKKGP
ncbi:MAG: class I SAM-dependent methyltransferase [Candidatus Aenigmarchaeota archaeon]|nr:class I SAM-dependent methyltransferase [Candidatus Aenigmarchaeota archaeon]